MKLTILFISSLVDGAEGALSDPFLEIILISNVARDGLDEPLALHKQVCLVKGRDVFKLNGRGSFVSGIRGRAARPHAIGDSTVAR